LRVGARDLPIALAIAALSRFPAFPLSCFPAYRLARLPDDRHRLRHRHRGAGLYDVLEQGPPRPGNQLHYRFVGLDLREHITDGDGFAFLLLPFHQAALLHGRRKGFHDDLSRHL
jgi:hypothetical protein